MDTVNNLPAYAKEYPFIVARENDTGTWFWGAYDDINTAVKACKEIDGIIIENR